MQQCQTINILLPGPCNIQSRAARAFVARGSVVNVRSVLHRGHLFDLQSTRNHSIHIINTQNSDLSFSVTTIDKNQERLLAIVLFSAKTGKLLINNKFSYTRWTVDAPTDPTNDEYDYLRTTSISDLLNIEILPNAFNTFGQNRIDISVGNGGHIGLFFNKRRLMQVRFNPRYYVARTLDNIDRLYSNWLFSNQHLVGAVVNPDRIVAGNVGEENAEQGQREMVVHGNAERVPNELVDNIKIANDNQIVAEIDGEGNEKERHNEMFAQENVGQGEHSEKVGEQGQIAEKIQGQGKNDGPKEKEEAERGDDTGSEVSSECDGNEGVLIPKAMKCRFTEICSNNFNYFSFHFDLHPQNKIH